MPLTDRDEYHLRALADVAKRGWVLTPQELTALRNLLAERDALRDEVAGLRPLALAETTREA